MIFSHRTNFFLVRPSNIRLEFALNARHHLQRSLCYCYGYQQKILLGEQIEILNKLVGCLYTEFVRVLLVIRDMKDQIFVSREPYIISIRIKQIHQYLLTASTNLIQFTSVFVRSDWRSNSCNDSTSSQGKNFFWV